MDLSLAERAACPRCGPAFGLILLADEVAHRRVRHGVLGCPNCRSHFPVRNGVADLRSPPGRPSIGAETTQPPGAGVSTDPAAQALAAAAASGVGTDGGPLLLVGRARRLAATMKGLLPPSVELVLASGEAQLASGEAPLASGEAPLAAGEARLASGEAPFEAVEGSVVLVGAELPFFDGTFTGAVVPDAEASHGMLKECARLLKRGHRVVVLDPAPDVQARLGACGLMRFVDGSGVAAAGR